MSRHLFSLRRHFITRHLAHVRQASSTSNMLQKGATYQSPRAPRVPNSDTFYPLTDPAPGTALSSKAKSSTQQNGDAAQRPLLFTPIKVGQHVYKNRIFVSSFNRL